MGILFCVPLPVPDAGKGEMADLQKLEACRDVRRQPERGALRMKRHQETPSTDPSAPDQKGAAPSTSPVLPSHRQRVRETVSELRLLFDLSGENDAEVKGYMDALAKTGKYEVSDAIKAAIRDQFWGGFCDEAGTSAAIAKYYKEDGYLIDTHTAVAASVMEQYRQATGDETVTVFVSTASPYKFCDHVLRAIGETPAGDGVELLDQLHEVTGTAIPRRLAALKGKARRFNLTCEKPGMDGVVLEFLK